MVCGGGVMGELVVELLMVGSEGVDWLVVVGLRLGGGEGGGVRV